jgi:hypothetical protein
MISRTSCVAFALAGACAFLTVRPAAAQSDDAASAQALFDDAKKAMDTGDYATACPKFAESQRLDPGVGTLLALAACHEKQGKTASAWAEYLEVVTEAQRQGQAPRATFAKNHAADLESKLSKLTITVDPATAKLPGLIIKRDDANVRQASWGTALPVDPGSHTIVATATGKQKWTSQVDVGAQADTKSVAVPALEDEVTESAGTGTEGAGTKTDEKGTTETPPPASGGGGSMRTIGLIVGGVGVVGLVGGSIFGIEAISKSSQAKNDCPGGLCPASPSNSTWSNANSVNNDAKSAALISDVGFGVAVVGLGVGAALFLMSPSGGNPSTTPTQAAKNTFRVTPFVTRDGGGAAILASW